MNAVLKFEYKHQREYTKDLFCTSSFFFTATPGSAPMLSKDKTLFLTIIDNDNNNKKDVPRIIGRAKIKTNSQEITDEIRNKYAEKIKEWRWNKFVVLYDVQVIDGKIKQGIDLHSVIDKLGLSMFPNTTAKNPHFAYRQKSYRSISKEAEYYLNQELVKIGLKDLNETNISNF